MKYLVGIYKNGCFKLTTVNGKKVNLYSFHQSDISKLFQEAEEYTRKLSKYINDNSVNIYPFYDGTNEINYIGINNYQSECIAFLANEVQCRVIRDGGYVLYSEKYYKMADAGSGYLFYFDSLEEVCKKGLSIIKEFFYDSDEMQPEEEILKLLRQNLHFLGYLHGTEMEISIYKVTTLPKKDHSYQSITHREIMLKEILGTYKI